MSRNETSVVREICEREQGRAQYPDDFPAIPPLPSARYTDERFFQLEMEHVWRRTWLLAGHISELPEPGSYKLFDKLGESIILTRSPANIVHAFHNVCQHRGSALVRERTGKAKRFVCPYHAWTYSFDGTLVAVPEERNYACFDPHQYDLLPVRCETWRGHIFINLDANAGSLIDHLGEVPEFCEDFPFEDIAIQKYRTVEVDCNWKVAFDNFIEIYHIPTVHPAIMRWLETKSFSVDLLRNGHTCLRTKRRNGNRIVEDEARTPDGSFKLYQEYAINLPIFPHVAGALDPGGFSWTIFWPAGHNKTIIELPVFGAAREHDDEYWGNLQKEVDRLVAEDMELLPSVQRALVSGRLKHIPLSYHERAIYWYHEELDRRIGPDNIPPELRIERVLERHGE